MEATDLLAYVDRLLPGRTASLDTELADLTVTARLAFLRWLAGCLERPVDHEVLRSLCTLGDAWAWLDECRRSGEPMTGGRAEPRSRGMSTRVRLRPMTDDDLGPLYLASFDPEIGPTWRYRGRTLAPAAFVDTLTEGVRAQFVVELLETAQPAGLVVAYDHHATGLHCKVGFLRFGERTPGSGGAVMEGMALFISHLFASFPYRKVYAEVPEYNLAFFVEGFAEREGVLRDYLFHEGAAVDMHIMAIRREAWQEISQLTGW